MVRPLLGFLAETAAEIRQLRRSIVSATAGGIAIALLLPVVDRLLPRPMEDRVLVRILSERKTLILREPLIKKLLRRRS